MSERHLTNMGTANSNRTPDFDELAQRFDHPKVRSIVLMGSYARGNPGAFSDVDLVRFVEDELYELPGDGSHIIDERLVVVSKVTPTQVEKGFTRPEVAVEVIAGLRTARPLIDRLDTFAAIQDRANAFKWDTSMQIRANEWASQSMVGWIEEVHKGLEGLKRDDTGRLLHARFGCSWGLTRVMCVQRGVLLSGDNALFKEVTQTMGPDSEWSILCREAFGVDEAGTSSLRAAVVAGLQLYIMTAELLKDTLNPEDKPKIEMAVNHIKSILPEATG